MQLHVSCAIDCLFMCFLFWFLELYVQYQSCLIFCSAFVYCLSDFLSKLLTFARLLFGRFCLGTTSAFSQFHLASFCFFLFYGLLVCFPLVMAICFVMLAQFSCFCCSTWFLLFLLVLYWVWINLNFLTLLIFCVITYICAFCFCYGHPQLPRTHFFVTIPLQLSSLVTATIPANLLYFFAVTMHAKICPARAFVYLFDLFLVPPLPMHTIAPIRNP